MSREIISKPSGWLMYSGITMVGIAVFISFTVAALIQYPDTVLGTAMIVQKNAPVEVVARKGGIIDSIYASDGKIVSRADFIAVDDDLVKLFQISHIDSMLGLMTNVNQATDWSKISIDSISAEIPLGSEWNELIKQLRLFQDELKSDIFKHSTDQILKEIQQTKALSESLQKQINIYARELSFSRNEKDRNTRLYKQSVISVSDYEKAESVYLNQARQLEVMKSSLINNNVRITNLESSLLKLKSEHEEKLKSGVTEIGNLVLACKNLSSNWKKDHLYQSPIAGKFIWAEQFSSKPFVQGGQLLGTIIPRLSKKEIVAYSMIPSTALIDVQEGIDVQLVPQSYPLADYGYLPGKVIKVSELPAKSESKNNVQSFEYLVTISLGDSLISSTGQKISYKPKMMADIKIFTKHKSILSHILAPVRRLLNGR